MKKCYLILLFIFLMSCSIPFKPQSNSSYQIESSLNIADIKGQSIRITTKQKGVEISKIKPTIESIMKNLGFNISNKETRYLAFYEIHEMDVPRNIAIPIYGQTNINSFDTTYLGGGMYHTRANYNNDIIGYQNRTVYNHAKYVMVGIIDQKYHEQVYLSVFTYTNYIDSATFSRFFEDVARNYPYLEISELYLYCSMKNPAQLCVQRPL